jgi:hypothetical protein
MLNEIIQSIDSSVIPITVDKDDNACHLSQSLKPNLFRALAMR